MSANTLNMIKENDVKWVDLRFTDTKGKEQHVTLPVKEINDSFFEDGKMFDGSSIAGWKGINDSDMVLMPDDSTAVIDPFTDDTTMNLRCDIVEPTTMQGYNRDPRSIAERAESYMKSTGIADSCMFGPEPEFFVFDDVKWHADISGAGYEINSEEAASYTHLTLPTTCIVSISAVLTLLKNKESATPVVFYALAKSHRTTTLHSSRALQE